MTSRRGLVLGLLAFPMLAGCKIVKNGGQTSPGGQAGPSGTDQNARVSSEWDSKIVPYAQKKAAPLKELRAALGSAPDQAIAAHGFASGNGAKPVVFTSIEGTIVEANSESRAATIMVDTTGSGKPDVAVQIGPVIRGAALRDGLSFVTFSQFANQIDYADYGKALNAHVRNDVLKGVDRNALKGKHVRVVGAFYVDSAAPMPLVTPVTLKVGSAS